MTTAEAPETYADLSAHDLIRNEIKTERTERIKVARINVDDSVIDQQHALDLADSIKNGSRKQLSPITVRARFDGDGETVYDVIDGFHRSYGSKLSEIEELDAKVLYGCNDEEMYDYRILAVSSVGSVQYVRTAEWMQSSFEQTPWGKGEKPLPVYRLFAAIANDSKSIRGYDFSEEDIVEMKGWGKDKVKKWGQKSVGETYTILRTVANADPTLARQVREPQPGGDQERHTIITPDRLQTVVGRFQGEGYYAAQRAIMNYAIERRFYPDELKWLVQRLGPRISEGESQTAVREAIRSLYREEREAERTRRARQAEDTETTSLSQTPIDIPPDVQVTIEPQTQTARSEDKETFADDEEELADTEDAIEDEIDEEEPETLIRVIVDDEEIGDEDLFEDEPDKGKRVSAAVQAMQDLLRESNNHNTYTVPTNVPEKRVRLGGTYYTPEEMRERIDDLEKALKKSGNNKGAEFWRTATYLTPDERTAMESLFDKSKNLDDVASEMKRPITQVVALVQSSFAKRSLQFEF